MAAAEGLTPAGARARRRPHGRGVGGPRRPAARRERLLPRGAPQPGQVRGWEGRGQPVPCRRAGGARAGRAGRAGPKRPPAQV